MTIRKLFILLLITVFIALSGCGGTKKRADLTKLKQDHPIATETDVMIMSQRAKDYTQSGKFLDAALIYTRLASDSLEPDKQHFQLLAVETLLSGNYLIQATQLLDEINVDFLEQSFKIRKTLLNAKIALSDNKPDIALKILGPLKNLETTAEITKQLYNTRANAYSMAGYILETVKERIQLESLITSDDERKENQLSILNTLAKLSDPALKELIVEPPSESLRGWLELSRITKTYQKKPSQLSQEIKQWRANYPQHSALDDVVSNMLYREEIAIIAPKHIALLLPKNNKFAKAASAIKDGFLSAYFAQHSYEDKPTIQVYDSGTDADSFWTEYNRAILEGADFVIGPLDKPSVKLLEESSKLEVPTLALNYSDNNLDDTTIDSPKNLFQFGLSPEDEAAQVAERAWLNGYSKAIVLIPQGNWGTRVHNAFKSRWEQLGGTVAERQTYNPQKNDFSTSIRKILNIDESERRQSLLHATVNHKTFFVPRRRQDIDFVFIGAFPRQARQIRPQLKFYHASNLPVYATSHIFTGKINAQMDRDMNGVFFGDMPWVVPEISQQNTLKKEINKLWPGASESYSRLYALGIDAYNMIPSLNRLIAFRSEYFRGETGNLYLDDNNRIHRRLLWLGFEKGVPTVLDSLN
ncbi:MAG: ABC transporter substrate-binding protein [Gammaproteobacteria bacterium]|nr:ABC transporter substrate-binding protein [Gammaproteobacteria bacterium]